MTPPGRPAGIPSHPTGDPGEWEGWPGWAYDLAVVRHYAPLLAAALLAAFPESQVRAAVATYYHRHLLNHGVPAVVGVPSLVSKAKSDHASGAAGDASRKAAADFLTEVLVLDPQALLDVLRALYGDAWMAGAHAALLAAQDAGASGAVIGSGFGALDALMSWDAWTPGWAEAALALAGDSPGSGLAALLDGADITIRGVSGALLDTLGDVLADGVARGANLADLTDSVLAVLGGSGVRAETIAWTEVARAMSAATMATYSANGIALWEWLISPGACPECESEALNNPHTLNDDPPPAHPRCRCCASPVVTIDAATADSASAADVVDAAVEDGGGAAM